MSGCMGFQITHDGEIEKVIGVGLLEDEMGERHLHSSPVIFHFAWQLLYDKQ